MKKNDVQVTLKAAKINRTAVILAAFITASAGIVTVFLTLNHQAQTTAAPVQKTTPLVVKPSPTDSQSVALSIRPKLHQAAIKQTDPDVPAKTKVQTQIQNNGGVIGAINTGPVTYNTTVRLRPDTIRQKKDTTAAQ